MVNNISKINQLLSANPIRFVGNVENEYHQRIKDIAIKVDKNRHIKIILLAGPSSSGKTTGAHILRDYLLELGHKTEIISLDDFFKPQNKMPIDEYGKPDFESVHSLETQEIVECFNRLLKERCAELPVFNFTTKCREAVPRRVILGENDVIIVEGLHALHPLISDNLPKNALLKLYVSVVGCYVDDGGRKILDSRTIRLMRRISRDMIYRNSTPQQSLELWTSVVRGEEKYLCPHRSNADFELMSFHDYELCVFKGIMENIFKALPSTVENYESIKAILYAMDLANTLSTDYVPQDSLLREFMRGGKYE